MLTNLHDPKTALSISSPAKNGGEVDFPDHGSFSYVDHIGRNQLMYLSALTKQASGSLSFRTGSGRIQHDLLEHWPTLNGWEEEARELCLKMSCAFYLLARSLLARDVEIDAVITPTPLTHPVLPETLTTFLTFDTGTHIERHGFVSQNSQSPLPEDLAIGSGVLVLCRPLDYQYHEISGEGGRKPQPQPGSFENTEIILHRMLGYSDLTVQERDIICNLISGTEPSSDLLLPEPRTFIPAVPLSVASMEALSRRYASDESGSVSFQLGMTQIALDLQQSNRRYSRRHLTQLHIINRSTNTSPPQDDLDEETHIPPAALVAIPLLVSGATSAVALPVTPLPVSIFPSQFIFTFFLISFISGKYMKIFIT